MEPAVQPTRHEILKILKQRGRATADELAHVLGVTTVAVRQHLALLERDGYVERTLSRERPGKPVLVFRPTTRCEDLFPKRYDSLAEKLLAWVDRELEPAARTGLYQAVAAMLAARYESRVQGKDLAGRVAEVGRILDEEGYLADCEQANGVYRISWHTCPYYRVAQSHRDVCLVDIGFLSRLLGVEVALGDCLLDGAGRCTSTVPDDAGCDLGVLGTAGRALPTTLEPETLAGSGDDGTTLR